LFFFNSFPKWNEYALVVVPCLEEEYQVIITNVVDSEFKKKEIDEGNMNIKKGRRRKRDKTLFTFFTFLLIHLRDEEGEKKCQTLKENVDVKDDVSK
jgi:hypothetical protein